MTAHDGRLIDSLIVDDDGWLLLLLLRSLRRRRRGTRPADRRRTSLPGARSHHGPLLNLCLACEEAWAREVPRWPWVTGIPDHGLNEVWAWWSGRRSCWRLVASEAPKMDVDRLVVARGIPGSAHLGGTISRGDRCV